MNCLHPHDGPVFDELAGADIIIAKNQEGVNPLRAITDHTTVLTRWTPTEEQRQAIASGDDIFLEVRTYGTLLQPVRLTVGMTIDEAKEILGLTEAKEQA